MLPVRSLAYAGLVVGAVDTVEALKLTSALFWPISHVTLWVTLIQLESPNLL
jgi:hypothetical protein